MMSEAEEIKTMLDTLSEQLDPATVLELVGVYRTNSRQQVAKIVAAQTQGDLATLSSVAHSLKSSSANLGASALSAACLKLERVGAVDTATAVLVHAVEVLHEEALTLMTAWKPTAARA